MFFHRNSMLSYEASFKRMEIGLFLLESWSRPSTGVEATGRHVQSICYMQDMRGLLLKEFLFQTATSHFHPSVADLSDARGPAFWSGFSATVLRVLNALGPPELPVQTSTLPPCTLVSWSRLFYYATPQCSPLQNTYFSWSFRKIKLEST